MNRDAIGDELRRIEHEVVEAEAQLAEQEALVMRLTQSGEDTTSARETLEIMRKAQRDRDLDRQRLLGLLHP